MRWFLRLPIRRKLIALILGISTGALVFVALAVLSSESILLRRMLQRDVLRSAEMIAGDVVAPLTFADDQTAGEILSSLSADDRVLSATLYDRQGNHFAVYAREGAVTPPRTRVAGAEGFIFGSRSIEVVRPVRRDGLTIGTLVLSMSTAEHHRHLLVLGWILSGLVVASVIVAMLLSEFFQRWISNPIMRLADLARRVSVDRDYAVRADVRRGDEIGLLVDGFNDMLTQIQARDAALEGHRTHLESEVAERTVELVRTNTALTEAIHRAEKAARIKSEFLANMSHEIRTPMNGILGMTEHMLAMEADIEKREQLEIVRRSAESLLGILNDILDVSKIEAGKMRLERASFHLLDCLQGALQAVLVRAKQKGLELGFSADPAIPTMIVGDPGRLRQIVLNLLGNAIKFTARGSVLLQVAAHEENETSCTLRFVVRDTGIGIPAEMQREVFEAFTQADGSTTRRYGGTGLGLTISAQLVQLMEGRIWVESEVDRGSSFYFTARFGRAPENARTADGGTGSSPAAAGGAPDRQIPETPEAPAKPPMLADAPRRAA